MIYEKTPLGVQAFHQKPSQLSTKLRSILIMIDGKKPLVDLMAVLAVIGGTPDHLAELVSLGLIQVVPDREGITQADSKQTDVRTSMANKSSAIAGLSDQQLYERAYPIATKLTSGLGLRGFRLNLAVEGAGNINDLVNLSDKIRDAVGDAKFAELKPYLS